MDLPKGILPKYKSHQITLKASYSNVNATKSHWKASFQNVYHTKSHWRHPTLMWIPPDHTEGILPKCESQQITLHASYSNVNPTKSHWKASYPNVNPTKSHCMHPIQMWIPPNHTERHPTQMWIKYKSHWRRPTQMWIPPNHTAYILFKCESHQITLKGILFKCESHQITLNISSPKTRLIKQTNKQKKLDKHRQATTVVAHGNMENCTLGTLGILWLHDFNIRLILLIDLLIWV